MKLHIAEFTPHPLDIDLIRAERTTLAISVYPDQRVEAISPQDATEEEITRKILKRRRWILRQQKYFRQLGNQNANDQPQLLLSGAEVLYLGRQYRLKIELNETNKKASLHGRFLHVPVQNADASDAMRKSLSNWYRTRANDYLSKRFEKVFTDYSHLIFPKHQLRIRVMKTRWGSCTTKGTITLNPLLILAPSHLIDYVIIHELCHLKQSNHGKAFYQLLATALPDYRTRKNELDQFGARIKGSSNLFSF